MATIKPIIGRQWDRRPEYSRTQPAHIRRLPWAHEIEAQQNLKQEAKHWLVLAGLVALCACAFLLPWGNTAT